VKRQLISVDFLSAKVAFVLEAKVDEGTVIYLFTRRPKTIQKSYDFCY